MKELNVEEREFLERVKEAHQHKRDDGYWYFTFRNKHYKRSRILIQLHLNKKLDFWEQVHHKDMNRENDSIKNLEVIDTKEFNHHLSLHHHKKTKYNMRVRIGIPPEKINEIFKLSKIMIKKRRGNPNYKEIGRTLGISGNTVRRYILGFKQRFKG